MNDLLKFIAIAILLISGLLLLDLVLTKLHEFGGSLGANVIICTIAHAIYLIFFKDKNNKEKEK